MLDDGDYWAVLSGWSGSDAPSVTFHVTQAFFADACIAQLGADGCDNGYGVVDEPSREVQAVLTDLQTVTVVADNQQNFAITAAELGSLAGGSAPSSPAPATFAFGAFPFLVTVRDGKVVEAHQIWVP